MDNPLASPGGQGHFRYFSKKNKQEDLKRIVDRRGEKLISPGNKTKFPNKIFVINLDRREDRWENFKINNDYLANHFEIQRFSAIEGKKPVDAIFESYVKCLTLAFENEESVIIMEDDAYLIPGGIEKLKAAYKELPSDWDCLIGNHYFIGEIEILSENLAKPVVQASTLNFCIFRKTILEKIQNNLHKRDISLLDIDHFITNEGIPINNYSVWPMVSREIPSFSDHKGMIKDMTIRIREHANLYQFIDSETYYPSLQDW